MGRVRHSDLCCGMLSWSVFYSEVWRSFGEEELNLFGGSGDGRWGCYTAGGEPAEYGSDGAVYCWEVYYGDWEWD